MCHPSVTFPTGGDHREGGTGRRDGKASRIVTADDRSVAIRLKQKDSIDESSGEEGESARRAEE